MKNKRKIIEPIVHLMIWVCFYLLFVLVVKTIGPFKRIDNTLLLPVTFGTIINAVLFYTTSVILIPRFSENKRIGSFIMSLLLLLLSLTILETFIDRAFFIYYYSDSEESLTAQLILNLILNLIVLSLALGYGFTKNWLRNEKLKQELIRDKLSAELNLLRSQLNPHFLFNVLNMAFSSANRSGDERTADIIEKISGLMRYTTYESNNEKINLDRELEYLKNYINLQKMRFSDDVPVNVELKVKGEFSDCTITPLLLVQFVENAFKHGVMLGKESNIEISLCVENHVMVFITKNAVYKKMTSDLTTPGVGISNVKKRLSILYPGKHTLLIENPENLFIVKLIMDLESK